jgi:hypothetical protein
MRHQFHGFGTFSPRCFKRCPSAFCSANAMIRTVTHTSSHMYLSHVTFDYYMLHYLSWPLTRCWHGAHRISTSVRVLMRVHSISISMWLKPPWRWLPFSVTV